MHEVKHLRTVRSFVRREGRMSEGQKRALEILWPKFGIDCGDEKLRLDTIFGRSAPKNLEIGFGSGDAILTMARNHPEEDFLGIDVYRPGGAQIMGQAEREGLSNVRVMTCDAVDVLKRQINDASLDNVYIFFPDPWHKKRHHKRRLIQPDFVSLLACKLKPGGNLFLATDWEDYALHMVDVLKQSPLFENASAPKTFSQRNPRRPETRFERRGQRLGHGVWDLHFVRRVINSE